MVSTGHDILDSNELIEWTLAMALLSHHDSITVPIIIIMIIIIIIYTRGSIDPGG